MKKPISLLLVICLIFAVFVGCSISDEKSLIGTWNCYIDGWNVPFITLEFEDESTLNFSDIYTANYTIKDGTITIDNEALDIHIRYQYELNDDKDELYLTDNTGILTDETLIFKKEG